MRRCELRDLGRIEYGDAFERQRELVERRKRGEIPDQFLIVEHPHTLTLGRNGKMEHLLAEDSLLKREGVSFYPTDRGGDITYHGPGQIVGYPILDLREWKRDVGAYVRGLEETMIGAVGEFGIEAGRIQGLTGVWVNGAKLAAIGVHVSRWVTSHGFALNVDTDLRYFGYIVPCGLSRPVTSMARLGATASRKEVTDALARHFARVFDCEIVSAEMEMETAL